LVSLSSAAAAAFEVGTQDQSKAALLRQHDESG